MRQLGKL